MRSHAGNQPSSHDRPQHIARQVTVGVPGPWRAVAIGAAAIALGFGALALIWLLARPLALLILAVTLGEALAPLVSRLQRWLPRWAAIAVVYLVVGLVLVGFGWLTIPPLVDQGQRLAARGPALLASSELVLEDRLPGITDRVTPAVSGQIDQFAETLIDLPFTVFSSLVEIVLLVFLSVYWLVASPALRQFVFSLLPERQRDEAADVMREIGQAMGGYVRGVVIDAAAMGLLAYGGLQLIGYDYPVLGGLLTMLGEIVPVVGPLIAAVPIVAIGLLHSPTMALLALAVFAVLSQLEGHLLTPNIMRSQTHVSQVLVLAALFAGGTLGGILGALVAIPLAGALKVLAVRIVAPAVRRWTGAERSGSGATGAGP